MAIKAEIGIDEGARTSSIKYFVDEVLVRELVYTNATRTIALSALYKLSIERVDFYAGVTALKSWFDTTMAIFQVTAGKVSLRFSESLDRTVGPPGPPAGCSMSSKLSGPEFSASYKVATGLVDFQPQQAHSLGLEEALRWAEALQRFAELCKSF